MATLRESGHYAIAGFLYQLIGSGVQAFQLLDGRQNNGEPSEVLLLECLGQDAAVLPSDGSGSKPKLIQYKYSTTGKTIAPSELREILQSLLKSIRDQGMDVHQVEYKLVTNRKYSPEAEKWVAAKENHERLQQLIRSSCRTEIDEVPQLASIFQSLERHQTSSDELREELLKTGRIFGMLDDEIRAGIDELIGLLSDVAFERHRLRELLKKWIYQYPQTQMLEVRSRILNDVQRQLEVYPTRELLWVVSSIGFRTPEITELLWPLLEREEEIADAALGVMASLGAAPPERERLLDVARDRLSSRGLSHGVLIAVQEFVGPQRIELAQALLRRAVEQYPNEDHVDFSLAVSVVTQAVERCVDDRSIHEETWAILRNHIKTVRMTSDYGACCDTKATVEDHVAWLLGENFASDRDIAAYVMLSRLSDLTKPRQLASWDDVATDELTQFLKSIAQRDTKVEGQFTTTSYRLKLEAWEAALTVGCSRLEDWIDAAIVEETNPYAVLDVANIVSCLRISRLPERLLNELTATETSNDGKGYLFRQVGLIRIAQSSCTREAFETLLNFGLTHDGNVLLSTIDAITDLAIWRIRKGDQDVIEKILGMTKAGNQKRHREAMISAFCRLCVRGLVPGDWLNHLWIFANADDLDDPSRRAALEAIGLTDFEQASAWVDSVRQIAASEAGELGWRACEVMVRRDWLTEDDEPWFFSRLALAKTDSRIWLRDAAKVDGWQAFLIGLLFRKDKDRFQDAVRDIVAHAPADAMHQILDSLRHHGNGCPDSVTAALAGRIRASNDRAIADTELFNVLGAVAPAKLLTLAQVSAWNDWLVEGRTALCEAIRTVAAESSEHPVEAVACLVRFMRDASLQVRRSAYRAIALSDVHVLESICLGWSQSKDVELKKRATEAAAWLPVSYYSDEMLRELGFGWDPEPSVREVWKDVLSERRTRLWATEYLERVFASAGADDQALLNAYGYGRALTKIGDDESVKRIHEFLARRDLRPNVRHWLLKISREIVKQWKKVTEKWGEPWTHEQGSIEILDGEIVFADGKRLKARFSLWSRYRSGPSDLSTWGGVAEYSESQFPSHLGRDEIEIQIPGRTPASAWVSESKWSGSAGAKLILHANSPYPAALRDETAEGESSLVDVVAKIIRDTSVGLTQDEAELASHRLQPLLERADVSLFSTHPQYDAGVRMKFACQEAALITRTLAESLPRTFQSSVVLWRIANSILEKESLALRLSPAELDRLGELARLGALESPDELLFWMIDRVKDEPSREATCHAARTALNSI